MKTQVEYKGVKLDVDFTYTPASAGHNVLAGPDPVPPEPASVEINSIRIGEQDASQLFAELYEIAYSPVTFQGYTVCAENAILEACEEYARNEERAE